MQLVTMRIDKPESTNFILGQTHFIKTVEDVHEVLVAAVPGIRFGLAFCEASGQCLVRGSGTNSGLEELARSNALALAAGHSFIIFLGDGFYPIKCTECDQDGSGGLPHLLRDRQSNRGCAGRN